MNWHWFLSGGEEEESLGPGTALVLSLFAMLLLVGALMWAQSKNQTEPRPVTMAVFSEDKSSFARGQAKLEQDAKATIQMVIQRARTETHINHLQVIGYASPEGKGNRELAWKRASEVRDYMVNQLRVPEECVVVATFADSHSPSLRAWLSQGHNLQEFRSLPTEQQRQTIGERNLAEERRVAILGVFHADSICSLSNIPSVH
jgi:hypothetical protein